MAKGKRGGKRQHPENIGTEFVSFPPSPLKKEGERVVSITADGEYIYNRQIPSFQFYSVDTSSTDYRRALKDYNIKAKFNNDGTVTVSKGGLFSRKKTFKTVEDFQSNAFERIDKQKEYWNNQERRIKAGRLTQIEAEQIKTTVRNFSKSMAIKNINQMFKDNIAEAVTFSQAGEDMKRRLKMAIQKNLKKK